MRNESDVRLRRANCGPPFRPTIQAGAEIGLEVSDGIDGPEKRHRDRPGEKERTERVDATDDEVDRIRPDPRSDEGWPSTEHRDHGDEHERRGDGLAADRR